MPNNKIDTYTSYCSYYDTLPINSNLVFFESHNSMDFAGNMLSIVRELSSNDEFQNIEIAISYLDENKEKIDNLLKRYKVQCTKFIRRESMEYFEILASAGYLFTDVAFFPLFRKKVGQICVTAWHGTPLKTLGFTFCEDSYVVANQKRGFILSDYFICPNEYTWECIRTSYQLDGLFKGTVIYGGYPRNSIFFDQRQRNDIKKELHIENKKLVVYMPTWRGKVIQVNDKGQSMVLQELLSSLDEIIQEDYVFFTKLHRLNQEGLDYSLFKHIEPFPEGYETYDILNGADILVTDYSSVMFDFLSTGKKIILFCYDQQDYMKNRGCYFNVDKLPFPIVTSLPELANEISSPKEYDDGELMNKFVKYDNPFASQNICKHILSRKNVCKTYRIEKRTKKKMLIFVGDLGESQATDSLFFIFDKLKEYECYITYMNHLFKEKWYKLLQFSGMNQIPLYMYRGRYSNYCMDENQSMARIRKQLSSFQAVSDEDWNVLEKIGKREYTRYKYENEFQIFVRFAGLDLESLKWFQVYQGTKIIVIHENMIKKAEQNHEYRIYLFRALDTATEIHYANQEIFKRSEILFGKAGTRKIIANLY